MLRTAAAGGTGGLVIEMTDGTSAANAEFRRRVGFYYDLVKANVERIVTGLSAELAGHPITAVGVTPGWLRSERMLENFGVTGDTWREACTWAWSSSHLAVAAYRLLSVGLASVLAAPGKVAASIGAAWSATNRRARRYL